MDMIIVATADFCSALFIGICFISLVARGKTDRNSDLVFKTMLLFDFIMALSGGIWYTETYPHDDKQFHLSSAISYFSYYIVLFLICLYVYAVIKRRIDGNLSKIWYIMPLIFTTMGLAYWMICESLDIFYLDSRGHYIENTYYWVGQVFGYGLVIWFLMMIVTYKKVLTNIQFILFSLVVLLPSAVAVMRSVLGIPNLLIFSISLVIFILYVKDYIDEQQRFLEQKEKLADAELSMMISQVQPHFLYNMFNTIYYLCAKDVEQAQEVIGEFSDYLRTNLDSISKTQPVPFSEELENIKRYVYLEKLRFEDKLDVVYNIESVDFEVPVLSIRPLVENSIKHGVGKIEGTLIVQIMVRELPNSYEVEVSDNGPGYDPSNIPNDGRSHVGLENLRHRLRLMSDTSLSISGIKNVGTRAVIQFKKRKRI